MGALLDLTESNQQQSTVEEFMREVVNGLSKPQKTLPCKYFYDEQGSRLFEAICELEEYYVTRTELALLKQIMQDIAAHVGPDAAVIEPGSGAGKKIRLLLDSLESPACYTPVEISKEILIRSVEELSASFPDIPMKPIAGDFDRVFSQPEHFNHQASKKVVFFPGSTIGNFEHSAAQAFLKRLADSVGKGGGLLIGVDLIKEEEVLLDAYNDSQGITAAFNKNLLARINRELDGDFELDAFCHQSIYNQDKQRIEMHLISNKTQTVEIKDHNFCFAQGETIHTENSHKYSVATITKLAETAGFTRINHWCDDNEWFGTFYFEVAV